MAKKSSYELKFEGFWRAQDKQDIPENAGIYCVYEAKYIEDGEYANHLDLLKLIYVGESKNVRQRIIKHEKFREWNQHTHKGTELCFSYALYDKDEETRKRISAALIFQHQPPSNKKQLNSFPYEKTHVVVSGPDHNNLLTESFDVDQKNA
jgi:excinuclease UvrABC nuclease subunit